MILPLPQSRPRLPEPSSAAYLAWFVRALMLLTSPITYPIALFLDWLLGEEPMFFRLVSISQFTLSIAVVGAS